MGPSQNSARLRDGAQRAGEFGGDGARRRNRRWRDLAYEDEPDRRDFFCAPPCAVADLEAALAGVPAMDAPAAAGRFFATQLPAICGAGAEDFPAALAAALAPN